MKKRMIEKVKKGESSNISSVYMSCIFIIMFIICDIIYNLLDRGCHNHHQHNIIWCVRFKGEGK